MGVVCHLRELMRPTMGRVPVCVPVCSPHAALTLSAKYHLLFVCFFVIPILCLLMVVVPSLPSKWLHSFFGRETLQRCFLHSLQPSVDQCIPRRPIFGYGQITHHFLSLNVRIFRSGVGVYFGSKHSLEAHCRRQRIVMARTLLCRPCPSPSEDPSLVHSMRPSAYFIHVI
ncbi:hypothetical protein BKA83DRAFT_1290038 [Pisolithus microcarpus]|nr:hypothetical protein BKA83DRAFT_1290038 [Pisolithus microcarpus]